MIETGVGFPNPLFFIGVVENNIDERLEGRVQVRAFGFHGTNEQIPTKDLPWATLIIGSHDVNFVVPPLNAWVFGFFLDGRAAQSPFVLGLIPTQYTAVNDPRASGWGVAIGQEIDVNAQGSRPQDFGQPTLSRLARGEELENTYLLPLETNRVRDIPIAGGGSRAGSIGNAGAGSQDTPNVSEPSNAVSPGYPSDMSQAEIESIIRQEATLRGMDPDTAIEVYRHEGAGAYQSQFTRSGNGSYGGKEASFGPYQLYTGGGLGNEYENKTGRSLLTDNTRDGVTNQIRFALDKAATNGWGAWYGADAAGISDWEGLSGAKPVNNVNYSPEPTITKTEIIQTPSGPQEVERTYRVVDTPNGPQEVLVDPTANSPYVQGGSATASSTYSQTVWEEPAVAYNASYPYNRVIETGSGHVIELDDTPGAERIMIHHRNGSYIQMTPSTTSIKSIGDSYEVNDKNYHMYVGGTNIITIEGDSHVLVKGNKIEEIMGNYQQIIHGNHEVGVGGQANINSGEQFQLRGGNLVLESNVENLNIKTSKTIRFESGETMHFKSKNIFMQGEEGLNFKGKDLFTEISAGINFKSETTQFEASGDFGIKADHAIIGGGQLVSINASTVAMDDEIHMAEGMAGSPVGAESATDAESAIGVERPAPPSRTVRPSRAI